MGVTAPGGVVTVRAVGLVDPSCPRCRQPITDLDDGTFACEWHGVIAPLWRPVEVGYDAFAELVRQPFDIPTYLPWPMSPGWSIADFGSVDHGVATFTTTVGSSDMDGPVEVTVVAEDPGVGLGARAAGSPYVDPGPQVGVGPPTTRVRAAGRPVPLWLTDPGGGKDTDDPLERSVFAGEADGRWLWIVLRPASAALLLQDEWLLADATGFGPEALEMPFGGQRPAW
jgi:hypothetical protein